MKVALVIQTPDPHLGGAELYTLNLAKSLAARGHDVTLAAEDGPAAARDEATRGGIRCVYFGRQGRGRWPRMQHFLDRAKELYEGGEYEIVHAMLPVWKCDVYQPHSGLAAYLLARGHLKHPRRLVQRFSHMANQLSPKRVGQARVEAALMATRPWLLSISFVMRDFARSHYSFPEERIVMLRYGIDLARFDPGSADYAGRDALREQWNIRADQRVGMFIGHNWIRKGVPEAISALGMLREQGQGEKLVLLVIGRDDPHSYRKQAERLGVADRVLFAGAAQDPRPFYRAADFLLLPTRQDTCSIVVLEALTMGLPVITTMQNGVSELIEQGKQGLLTERGDSRAMAQAMQAMLDEPQRKAMAIEALNMRGQLSQEQHVATVEAVYRKIVAARHSQSAGSKSP